MASVHDIEAQLQLARLLPPGERERAVRRIMKAYRKHTGQTSRYNADGSKREDLTIYSDIAGKGRDIE